MSKPRKKPNGTWTLVVQFAGKRRNLTLGRLPKSQIDHFARNAEFLVEHVKHGGKTFPPALQAWISELNERHKVQFSEIGLFDYKRTGMTVGELCDKYVADYENRTDVTGSSVTKVRSAINNRLGKLRYVAVEAIEPVQRSVRQNAEPVWSDAAQKTLADFNSWQRNYYAAATWSRDNKLLSSVGIWAVKHGYLDHNPFSPLPSASMVNEDRNTYLTRESVLDAMESSISPDIRITLALGRLAGFRTCSEVRTLKWRDVDVEAGTLTIIDSKKRKPRVMPLFDDIREELEKQREITGNTRFVASSQMRSTSSSTNYQRICEAIRRSGQEPWPRIRQNLRASAENDLLELFDERLVTAWLGHTVTVSREHYQKLRPSDYRNAIAKAAADNPL